MFGENTRHVDTIDNMWGLVVEKTYAIMRAMFKRILIVTPVLVIVALAAVLIYLNQETRQLTGVVVDAAALSPIEGAHVSAAGYSAVTNTQGR